MDQGSVWVEEGGEWNEWNKMVRNYRLDGVINGMGGLELSGVTLSECSGSR